MRASTNNTFLIDTKAYKINTRSIEIFKGLAITIFCDDQTMRFSRFDFCAVLALDILYRLRIFFAYFLINAIYLLCVIEYLCVKIVKLRKLCLKDFCELVIRFTSFLYFS